MTDDVENPDAPKVDDVADFRARTRIAKVEKDQLFLVRMMYALMLAMVLVIVLVVVAVSSIPTP